MLEPVGRWMSLNEGLEFRISYGLEDPVQVDVLIAGFPCKSISALTTMPGSVLDNGCTSGQGYLGMEKYIKGRKPKLILIENVGRLFHKTKVEANNQSACLALKAT